MFILIDAPYDFIHRTHFEQLNKQHKGKVLLNTFHFNGHNLEFHPQTQKAYTVVRNNVQGSNCMLLKEGKKP